jgi:WD40 repeat protein
MATSNYNSGLIACAEYGLNPEMHVYRFPGKELVHKFAMDTTVKVISLSFSRCSKYLLMIGGVPDFKISIFDLENNKKLVLPETKLPCKPEEFIQAKFNPQNKTQFAILSQTCFYNYNIHQAYDVTMQGEKRILRDSYRLEHNTFKDENPELQFTRFIWDPYSRVEICTDQAQLLMVDPKNGSLDHTLNTTSRPVSCVLTQKHLIVSLEEGIIVWHTIEPPDVIVGDIDPHTQKMKILDDIEQDFTLNIKVGESDIPEFISYLHYSKNFDTLIMGTETGVFGILRVQAEAINYDEEEDEQQKKKERKTLTEPFIELGRFHTKNVNGIKELGESTQLVTISDDHYMSVWEATNQQLLSCVYQPAIPTALDVSKDGNTSFIGTVIGACRAYDVQDRSRPRLVMQQKFFEESIPISCIKSSQDGKYILFSSVQSKNVFVLSGSAVDGFQVLAFIEFAAKVCSAAFCNENGATKVIVVLANNLLATSNVPTKAALNRMIPMPAEEAQILYRKIDKGSNLVISNENTGDIFVTGEDKLLKKYEFPSEKIEQIDIKRAP